MGFYLLDNAKSVPKTSRFRVAVSYGIAVPNPTSAGRVPGGRDIRRRSGQGLIRRSALLSLSTSALHHPIAIRASRRLRSLVHCCPDALNIYAL